MFNDIEEERDSYPIHNYQDNDKPIECYIPFNSEHKFNLFIRDLNKSERNPVSADNNLMLVMKGAPERVLKRCSKIIIDGEELPLTKEEIDDIEQANNNFGS